MIRYHLDAERVQQCDASDALHAFGHGPSGARYLPHGGYHWPQVKDRATPAVERRQGPRDSRFADLMEGVTP